VQDANDSSLERVLDQMLADYRPDKSRPGNRSEPVGGIASRSRVLSFQPAAAIPAIYRLRLGTSFDELIPGPRHSSPIVAHLEHPLLSDDESPIAKLNIDRRCSLTSTSFRFVRAHSVRSSCRLQGLPQIHVGRIDQVPGCRDCR
jgi:hypothetical protein